MAGALVAAALEGEARKRLAAVSPPCEDRYQLSDDDIHLMLSAIEIEAQPGQHHFSLKERLVRRVHIVVDNNRFYVGKEWERVSVMVATMDNPENRRQKLAFVWHCDPVNGGLAAHGKGGFIGVAEAVEKRAGGIDWGAIFEQQRRDGLL